MTVQRLKIEAEKLSRLEQTELIHFLVELIASEQVNISEDLKDELDKRSEALNNEASIGRPAREVLKKYLNN